MSFVMDMSMYYGYKRAIHCLRMMKRYYDAGFDVNYVARNFTVFAQNVYGWSDEGDPLQLFYEMLQVIFLKVEVNAEYYGVEAEEKRYVLEQMEIPPDERDILNDRLSTYCLVHIEDNFQGVDFHFYKEDSKSTPNYFETIEDRIPIRHYRDSSLRELVILIDLDFYVQDADSLLQFALFIHEQIQ